MVFASLRQLRRFPKKNYQCVVYIARPGRKNKAGGERRTDVELLPASVWTQLIGVCERVSVAGESCYAVRTIVDDID